MQPPLNINNKVAFTLSSVEGSTAKMVFILAALTVCRAPAAAHDADPAKDSVRMQALMESGAKPAAFLPVFSFQRIAFQETDKPARQAPLDEEQLRMKNLERAVKFLLGEQRRDGSWGVQSRVYQGDVAVTALAVTALSRLSPRSEEISRAIEKGLLFVMNSGPESGVRTGDRPDPPWDMKVYSYSYTLSLLAQLPKSGDKSLLVKNIVFELGKILRKDGGMGYRQANYSTTFHTAVMLAGLTDIREDKEELDNSTVIHIKDAIS